MGYLVLAACIVAGGVAYGWVSWASVPAAGGAAPAELPVAMSSPASAAALHVEAAGSAAPRAPLRVATASSAAMPAATPRIPRTRDPDGDQTPDIADYINEGEKPTMGEVIKRLHDAGVHTGLGAFSPPGTRPPLVGLAVPDGFVLPEGYVRHYQATDDGQRIEPILMFSPDHQFFDAAHRPIVIPKDRVVPPELAPPGMPIRRIVVRAPVEPGK
jgi:hypothetical protein